MAYLLVLCVFDIWAEPKINSSYPGNALSSIEKFQDLNLDHKGSFLDLISNGVRF